MTYAAHRLYSMVSSKSIDVSAPVRPLRRWRRPTSEVIKLVYFMKVANADESAHSSTTTQSASKTTLVFAPAHMAVVLKSKSKTAFSLRLILNCQKATIGHAVRNTSVAAEKPA